MSLLEHTLGKTLSARQVADFLGCHISTVYKNYSNLGGVKLGRSYRFFEKSVINGILQQEKESMDCSGSVKQETVSISTLYKEKSHFLGIPNQKRDSKKSDRHNIIS